jgi:hypothetical protein
VTCTWRRWARVISGVTSTLLVSFLTEPAATSRTYESGTMVGDSRVTSAWRNSSSSGSWTCSNTSAALSKTRDLVPVRISTLSTKGRGASAVTSRPWRVPSR